MKINSFKFILSALLTVMSAILFAQQSQLQPLPMDPKIRYGKLDNGLTYYIRANKEPKERAEFHIAQNVGAILENDDQNGLAHNFPRFAKYSFNLIRKSLCASFILLIASSYSRNSALSTSGKLSILFDAGGHSI